MFYKGSIGKKLIRLKQNIWCAKWQQRMTFYANSLLKVWFDEYQGPNIINLHKYSCEKRALSHVY